MGGLPGDLGLAVIDSEGVETGGAGCFAQGLGRSNTYLNVDLRQQLGKWACLVEV